MKMMKAGKKIIGNSLTNTAHASTTPADRNRSFFLKGYGRGLFKCRVGSGDFVPDTTNMRQSNKKRSPALSICPEPEISITGKGCHAYKTARQAGTCITDRTLTITNTCRNIHNDQDGLHSDDTS